MSHKSGGQVSLACSSEEENRMETNNDYYLAIKETRTGYRIVTGGLNRRELKQIMGGEDCQIYKVTELVAV